MATATPDLTCPKCQRVIRGSGELVSVSAFLHAETPGECRPETTTARETLRRAALEDDDKHPRCDGCGMHPDVCTCEEPA